MKQRSFRKWVGFTLIEVMVAVIIGAVCVSLVYGALQGDMKGTVWGQPTVKCLDGKKFLVAPGTMYSTDRVTQIIGQDGNPEVCN
jgi:prepilin-type N-terminal cleavage/methylation domain-containing protein